MDGPACASAVLSRDAEPKGWSPLMGLGTPPVPRSGGRRNGAIFWPTSSKLWPMVDVGAGWRWVNAAAVAVAVRLPRPTWESEKEGGSPFVCAALLAGTARGGVERVRDGPELTTAGGVGLLVSSLVSLDPPPAPPSMPPLPVCKLEQSGGLTEAWSSRPPPAATR